MRYHFETLSDITLKLKLFSDITMELSDINLTSSDIRLLKRNAIVKTWCDEKEPVFSKFYNRDRQTDRNWAK